MTEGWVTRAFGRPDPFVGVIHAPPLPGSPGWEGAFPAVRERVRADARALAEGGADGVLLENFGDAPFYPGSVPPETVSHMTVLAREVREEAPELPLGINVLRNDGRAALAVAAAAGGSFIRVNVLAGARVTDQGIVEGRAHRLLRHKGAVGAGIRLLADVDVKHSAPLAPRPPEEEARELVERAGADAVILTGPATGEPVSRDVLDRVTAAVGEAPVWIGSGVTAAGAAEVRTGRHGVIIGSALRADGRPGGPVVPARVRELAQAWTADG